MHAVGGITMRVKSSNHVETNKQQQKQNQNLVKHWRKEAEGWAVTTGLNSVDISCDPISVGTLGQDIEGDKYKGKEK